MVLFGPIGHRNFKNCDAKFRNTTYFLELAEAVEYEEFDQPISIPIEFTGFDGPSVRIHLELQFFIPELR